MTFKMTLKMLICSFFLIAPTENYAQNQLVPQKINYLGNSFGRSSNFEIQRLGDSIILGKKCYELYEPFLYEYTKLRYFSFENRQIHGYSDLTQGFHLLYDFNLEAGDTLIMDSSYDPIYGDVFPRSYFLIDSTSQVQVDTYSLKVLHINYSLFDPNNLLWAGEKFIENIGTEKFFVPVDPLREIDFTLYCAELDSGIIFEAQGISCDSFLSVSTLDIPLENQALSVFPNPITEQFQIEYNSQNNQAQFYRITDTYGRIISSEKLQNGRTQFDCKHYPKGTYVVQCFNGQKQLLAVKRVVKIE